MYFHDEILSSLEIRISLLSVTYGKYMDLNLCCFIPGKVLDELYRLLRILRTSDKQLNPNNLLQELRDISSTAIEHFDNFVVYTLKNHCECAKRCFARNEPIYENCINVMPTNNIRSNNLQNSSLVSCIHGGGLQTLAFSTVTTELPDRSPNLCDISNTKYSQMTSAALNLPCQMYCTVGQNADYLNFASNIQALGSAKNTNEEIICSQSSSDTSNFYTRVCRKLLHKNSSKNYYNSICMHRNFINISKKLKSENNRELRKVLSIFIIYIIRTFYNIKQYYFR